MRKVLESFTLANVVAVTLDAKLVKNDIKFTAQIDGDDVVDVTGQVKTFKTVDVLVGQIAKLNPYATAVNVGIDVTGTYIPKTPIDPVAAATAEKARLLPKLATANANITKLTVKKASIQVWEFSANPGQHAQYEEAVAQLDAVTGWATYLVAAIASQDAVIGTPPPAPAPAPI